MILPNIAPIAAPIPAPTKAFSILDFNSPVNPYNQSSTTSDQSGKSKSIPDASIDGISGIPKSPMSPKVPSSAPVVSSSGSLRLNTSSNAINASLAFLPAFLAASPISSNLSEDLPICSLNCSAVSVFFFIAGVNFLLGSLPKALLIPLPILVNQSDTVLLCIARAMRPPAAIAINPSKGLPAIALARNDNALANVTIPCVTNLTINKLRKAAPRPNSKFVILEAIHIPPKADTKTLTATEFEVIICAKTANTCVRTCTKGNTAFRTMIPNLPNSESTGRNAAIN